MLDLNNLFNEFSTHHNDVNSALDLEDEGKYQEHDAFRVEADKCYFGAKGLSFKLHPTTKAESVPPIAAKRSLKVPDVQIPAFFGTITEWITFIGLYKTLVHDNPDLASIEKFQLLLTLVRNEPLSILQAIPISSENYSIAYEALVARTKMIGN